MLGRSLIDRVTCRKYAFAGLIPGLIVAAAILFARFFPT